jgi:hypothetical protein
MAKKVITLGAPLYMGQYTGLMTILLAFFILMQAMSTQQKSGFKEGIGEVRNAFGLQGGVGLFDYTFFGRGGSNSPNPVDSGKKEKQGIHENLVKSEGGQGNTEVDVADNEAGKFLRLKMEGKFARGKADMSPEMREYLAKIGMGFALFDYKISIRCFTDELKMEKENRDLALNRAAQIMRYLYRNAGVPFSRMVCAGYTTPSYLGNFKEKDYKKLSSQENYFYIYMKMNK